MKVYLLALLTLVFSSFAGASTFDEILTVKNIEAGKATLEGKTAGLKAGDFLYSGKSPFQYKITDVQVKQVSIALPDGSPVEVGFTFVRQPSESIKKAMKQEAALKSAIGE